MKIDLEDFELSIICNLVLRQLDQVKNVAKLYPNSEFLDEYCEEIEDLSVIVEKLEDSGCIMY